MDKLINFEHKVLGLLEYTIMTTVNWSKISFNWRRHSQNDFELGMNISAYVNIE